MKVDFRTTKNGVIIQITVEEKDTEEAIQELRGLRHAQAQASGVTESLKDTVSFFLAVKLDKGLAA